MLFKSDPQHLLERSHALTNLNLVPRQSTLFGSDGMPSRRTTSTQLMLAPHSSPRSPSPVDHQSPPQRYALFAIPYDLGIHQLTGRPRPWHWCIFALTGPGRFGVVYQLAGSPGDFYYPGPRMHTDPNFSQKIRLPIRIGSVWSDQMGYMERMIEQTPISQARSRYNCQNWTMDVLHRLHAHNSEWVALSPALIGRFLKRQERQQRR